MVTVKHEIHKYMRVKLSKAVVFRCMIPGCPHYKRPQFITNTIAECWYCGKNFVITPELARRKRVRCSDCIESKKPQVPTEVVTGFLEELKEKEND